MVNPSEEREYLKSLLESGLSTTEKSMRLMYHNMCDQLFWDGNKRTATLIANRLMIDNGAGLINVPLNLWNQWNKLISEYYRTNQMNPILDWTYSNAIQGVNLN